MQDGPVDPVDQPVGRETRIDQEIDQIAVALFGMFSMSS